MSRTYRRKNGWDHPTYDFIITEDGYIKKQTLDTNSVEYKLEQVKYHRDSKRYGGSVPHWFVNLYCERKLRNNTKQSIQRWIKNQDNIELLAPPYVKDAGWKYW